MVIVEVVGAGNGFCALVAPPPPQALRESNTTAPVTMNIEVEEDRRFLSANGSRYQP